SAPNSHRRKRAGNRDVQFTRLAVRCVTTPKGAQISMNETLTEFFARVAASHGHRRKRAGEWWYPHRSLRMSKNKNFSRFLQSQNQTSLMDQLIECVPNFSEGVNMDVIRQITAEIE